MNEKMTKILLDAYAPRFDYHFRDHPKKDEILPKLKEGGNPTELVDLWFAEAEMYSTAKFREATKNMPVNENGTVTFKVVD